MNEVGQTVDSRCVTSWVNLIRLRRQACSARRLAPFVQFAILLFGVFLISVACGADEDSLFTGDETPEQRTMRNLREQLEERRKNEEQRPGDNFEQVKEASLAELAKGAQMFAPETILGHDGLPLRPAPSVFEFESKADWVLLGFAGVVLAVLIVRVLARHQREAEIRLLSGRYLSDGSEVASFKMPEWFAPLPTQQKHDSGSPTGAAFSKQDAPLPNPIAEFFAEVPKELARIRDAVNDLGLNSDHAERRQMLLQIRELVSALKRKADCGDLRPIWQISSALELLLKRLADKSGNATPSTLQTIVDAADLLPALCVPGIRPVLIIEPPIRILAVDDDPLCLRALCFALEKAGLASDVATNGEQALALATEKPYDAIFMDIQMPEMDGLTACSKIRKTAANGKTPVVFVTIQSDFQTRTESTVHGGNDFMAKPFLVFELAVKSLTLVMRKRLQLR